MNRDLITKINQIVKTSPESLEMDTWEDGVGCGTTRCIAGWAIHLTIGGPLFVDDLGDGFGLHPSIAELAKAAGVGLAASYGQAIQVVAANLLDISTAEAAEIFHSSNGRAVEWLEEHSNQEV